MISALRNRQYLLLTVLVQLQQSTGNLHEFWQKTHRLNGRVTGSVFLKMLGVSYQWPPSAPEMFCGRSRGARPAPYSQFLHSPCFIFPAPPLSLLHIPSSSTLPVFSPGAPQPTSFCNTSIFSQGFSGLNKLAHSSEQSVWFQLPSCSIF